MTGVRRGDGHDEAAFHARNISDLQRGQVAFEQGEDFQPDANERWKEGWIHAAEIAQSKMALLRHRPLIREALMGAYRLLRNTPRSSKFNYRREKDQREVMTSINLALAHLPAEGKEEVL